MKKLIIILTLVLQSAIAQEVPAFMKDGEITVKLKNGKVYTFSTNEYMVVKRGAKKPQPVILALSPEVEVAHVQTVAVAEKTQVKRHKHIISGEIVSSESGLTHNTSQNSVSVETRRRTGVGLQYQNNIHKDLYLGGRVDTNGGVGVNLGFGF